MKKFLFGLAALPFLASVTLAAEPLSDPQMDRISAGAGRLGPGKECRRGHRLIGRVEYRLSVL